MACTNPVIFIKNDLHMQEMVAVLQAQTDACKNPLEYTAFLIFILHPACATSFVHAVSWQHLDLQRAELFLDKTLIISTAKPRIYFTEAKRTRVRSTLIL